MFNLGFQEILLICVVLIIVVGPERLPTLMKNVGKAVRTVRQASREIQSTVGLDEILRDDSTYPLQPRAPGAAPMATISRDAPPPGPTEHLHVAPDAPPSVTQAGPTTASNATLEPHADAQGESARAVPQAAAAAGGEKGQG
jgi:sec-independent protein translocase protein TatB